MPELVFSIDASALGDMFSDVGEVFREAVARPGAFAQPQLMNGRWRSETGQEIGDPFPILVSPPAAVEFSDENGEFASASGSATVSFSAELPSDAAALAIIAGGIALGDLPLSSLPPPAAPLPPPRSHRIGEANAPFVVPVFAERFSDHSKFLSAVSQLHEWVLQQPPFNEEGLGTKLAFDAHFWPSDPVGGLFGTYDAKNPQERLFHGDREWARRLLARWTGTGTSLILIDSNLRGGAGGQPGYSAWTSIAQRPGERWEAVCLHEIGHGLGLADEYLDSARAREWPARFEPNVSADPRPSRSPWATLATAGDEPAPTAGLQPRADAETIGTFQGARYRTDLYRSSDACLMKQTNQRFCAACRAHIRSVLFRHQELG